VNLEQKDFYVVIAYNIDFSPCIHPSPESLGQAQRCGNKIALGEMGNRQGRKDSMERKIPMAWF
jgi:hypothetical protein